MLYASEHDNWEIWFNNHFMFMRALWINRFFCIRWPGCKPRDSRSHCNTLNQDSECVHLLRLNLHFDPGAKINEVLVSMHMYERRMRGPYDWWCFSWVWCTYHYVQDTCGGGGGGDCSVQYITCWNQSPRFRVGPIVGHHLKNSSISSW